MTVPEEEHISLHFGLPMEIFLFPFFFFVGGGWVWVPDVVD